MSDPRAQSEFSFTESPPRAVNAHPLTILSGGQTGVDRAALDAALNLGIPCGGWCPQGRKAEDGPIPARYPLQELPGAGYLARTRKNVEDSDATLVISFGAPAGGTGRTVEFAKAMGKPHLIIDGEMISIEDGARRASEWLAANAIRRLNVAGPRASGEGRGYAFAFELVTRLLTMRGSVHANGS